MYVVFAQISFTLSLRGSIGLRLQSAILHFPNQACACVCQTTRAAPCNMLREARQPDAN